MIYRGHDPILTQFDAEKSGIGEANSTVSPIRNDLTTIASQRMRSCEMATLMIDVL